MAEDLLDLEEQLEQLIWQRDLLNDEIGFVQEMIARMQEESDA